VLVRLIHSETEFREQFLKPTRPPSIKRGAQRLGSLLLLDLRKRVLVQPLIDRIAFPVLLGRDAVKVRDARIAADDETELAILRTELRILEVARIARFRRDRRAPPESLHR
jgi:hypothetical protein